MLNTIHKASEGDYVVDDFEATSVARDTIRLDWYNDDIEGPTKGRVTEIVDIKKAMSIVIILAQAIERAEVAEARETLKKGKRK